MCRNACLLFYCYLWERLCHNTSCTSSPTRAQVSAQEILSINGCKVSQARTSILFLRACQLSVVVINIPKKWRGKHNEPRAGSLGLVVWVINAVNILCNDVLLWQDRPHLTHGHVQHMRHTIFNSTFSTQHLIEKATFPGSKARRQSRKAAFALAWLLDRGKASSIKFAITRWESRKEQWSDLAMPPCLTESQISQDIQLA